MELKMEQNKHEMIKWLIGTAIAIAGLILALGGVVLALN
jgi:hypothetical protein